MSIQQRREAIFAYVASHPDACRLTVAELIVGTKPPRWTLYRALQSKEGADAYIFAVRPNAARELIEAGVPLSEPPRRCGFSGGPHSSRRFKQRFGLTASQYRRQLSGQPHHDREGRLRAGAVAGSRPHSRRSPTGLNVVSLELRSIPLMVLVARKAAEAADRGLTARDRQEHSV